MADEPTCLEQVQWARCVVTSLLFPAEIPQQNKQSSANKYWFGLTYQYFEAPVLTADGQLNPLSLEAVGDVETDYHL